MLEVAAGRPAWILHRTIDSLGAGWTARPPGFVQLIGRSWPFFVQSKRRPASFVRPSHNKPKVTTAYSLLLRTAIGWRGKVPWAVSPRILGVRLVREVGQPRRRQCQSRHGAGPALSLSRNQILQTDGCFFRTVVWFCLLELQLKFRQFQPGRALQPLSWH